ncbi:hypothetical protein ALC62_15570 [Cyphomyrmex costatus]|uniref:Uncharacterized protein n=1 Tax=Cyphomyrmex costatus TaxID=456900 RepID=A0A195C122_9HYME|nr:hypothetical protein ALC62_15570 [Cyphomyrmex costatus]
MSRDGVRVTRIRARFKRPNVFRELKLLTGVCVDVAPPRNCGRLKALIRAFPTLPRIIPAFACVNAIRHPHACVCMGMQVGYLFRGHERMLMQQRDLWNIPGGSMSEGRGRLAGQLLLFYSRS